MEEKKYEGTVCITSQEYRELVTEATENRIKYEESNSKRWSLENQVRKLEKERDEAFKKLEETCRELEVCRSRLEVAKLSQNPHNLIPTGCDATTYREANHG